MIILICTILLLINDDNVKSVLALATPSSRRRSQKSARLHQNNKSTSGGGGFARQKQKIVAIGPTTTNTNTAPTHDRRIDDISDVTKTIVTNLFSVCSTLQNPKLYQPKWADSCKLHQPSQSTAGITTETKQTIVVATKDVSRGQILTLFPIHALGIRDRAPQSSQNAQKGDEFIAYNHNQDSKLFKQRTDTYNDNMNSNQWDEIIIQLMEGEDAAYSIVVDDKNNNSNHMQLFSMYHRDKDVIPGWLGGQITTQTRSETVTKDDEEEECNCIMLPLRGASPFCAVVATKDIKMGEEVIRMVEDNNDFEDETLHSHIMKEEELIRLVAKRYKRQIASLRIHIEMACETSPVLDSASSSSSVLETTHSKEEEEVHQLGPFHSINVNYPGLTQIHANPNIYSIKNFLSNDECERIIKKAQPKLQPCLVKYEESGTYEQDPARTSTQCNVPQLEVPSILTKITDLANCNVEQLEILQVLHYSKGQEFIPHTDGFSGRYSACGFEESTRLVTIFCYLNDVIKGGSTYFPELELDIQPRKGTAVIHFPADVHYREDKRTLHQGSRAIDDKWLLTTWVWDTHRTDSEYDESKLPSLSSDII